MMKIVKAETKHSKLLAEISSKSFRESHGMSASKEDIDTYVLNTYSEEKYYEELSNQANVYHIVYRNDQVAGYSKIIFNTTNLYVDEPNITKLDRIYILEKYHGQNLGAELLKYNIRLSIVNQQKGMWLAVWTENHRAINFYKKVGFSKIGSYSFKISETHSNPNHILYLKY